MTTDLTNLELPVVESPYDFEALFGNDNPVELEIGIGKGRFLLDAATARPDVNFVGIEWARKYHLLACERAARRQLSNIRFLRDDAAHTFRHALAKDSLSALHIYFPDPWPKKRHNKRRLVQTPFIDVALTVLKPESLLYLATDHVDYFSQMEEVCLNHPGLEPVERLVGEEAPVGVTNYEVKYREEGRVIHKLTLRVGKTHQS